MMSEVCSTCYKKPGPLQRNNRTKKGLSKGGIVMAWDPNQGQPNDPNQGQPNDPNSAYGTPSNPYGAPPPQDPSGPPQEPYSVPQNPYAPPVVNPYAGPPPPYPYAQGGPGYGPQLSAPLP